jgi:hypothetical protein
MIYEREHLMRYYFLISKSWNLDLVCCHLWFFKYTFVYLLFNFSFAPIETFTNSLCLAKTADIFKLKYYWSEEFKQPLQHLKKQVFISHLDHEKSFLKPQGGLLDTSTV